MHPRIIRPATLLVALLAAGPGRALADDEGSSHTAALVGASADTLGVIMRFDEKAGWSMDYRARPGATVQRIALPFLPADHAHYEVVVAPGRATITFVMVSREQVDVATPAIWIWRAGGAAGTVARRWTMGDLFTADELGKLDRSVSHVWWQKAPLELDRGRVLVDASGRAVAIDPARGTLGPP